jgi:hypothetical protein
VPLALGEGLKTACFPLSICVWVWWERGIEGVRANSRTKWAYLSSHAAPYTQKGVPTFHNGCVGACNGASAEIPAPFRLYLCLCSSISCSQINDLCALPARQALLNQVQHNEQRQAQQAHRQNARIHFSIGEAVPLFHNDIIA